MAGSLFREQAVQAYRDPERRRELLRSLPPAAWVAYLILGALFVGALVVLFVARVRVSVTAAGIVRPQAHERTVRASQSGIVRRVLVQDGAKVKRGDALVGFDASVLEAEIRRERGNLAEQARILSQLRKLNVASPAPAPMPTPKPMPSPASALLLGLAQQHERVNRAQRELDRLVAERALRATHAPVEGQIVAVHVREGAFVKAGEPLMQIAQPTSPLAGFMLVPREHAAHLKVGRLVRMRLHGYAGPRAGRARGRIVAVTLVSQLPTPAFLRNLSTTKRAAVGKLLVRVRLERLPKAARAQAARGLPFTGELVVMRQRLITLIFPPMRHLLD